MAPLPLISLHSIYTGWGDWPLFSVVLLILAAAAARIYLPALKKFKN